MVNFRYHGNYVGPGWSAGKYQRSVRGSRVPAVDEFDQTAKEHDAAYATPGADLKGADYKFYRSNIGQGWKRSAAALAVGLQGTLRPPSSFSSNEKTMGRAPAKVQRYRLKAKGGPNYRRRLAAALPAAAALFASPGYSKKTSKGLVRKSYRRSGASNSKSGGKFKKAKGGLNILDKFAKTGVVFAQERGAVMATTALEAAQSYIVGHAVCGEQQIRSLVAYSIVKMLATKLNRDIPDFQRGISVGAGRQEMLAILFWNNATGKQLFTYDITASDTWENLRTAVYNHLQLYGADTGYFMTFIEWQTKSVATTPAVGTEVLFRLDMTKARIQLYTKSSMKIQNRTINSSNNDEEGDVDNVPIYGKQYDGVGNHFFFTEPVDGNALYPVNNAIYAGTDLVISAKASSTINANLREPPPLSMIKNATKVAKAKLDPGEIKTSVLTFKRSFQLRKLLNQIAGSISNVYPIRMGAFRVFIFEKMIQAVATDNINGIKVAYELDAKYAAICTAPKPQTTTMVLNQSPV